MNSLNKSRTIGKITLINSDRFTVELLAGLENFSVNGYDDIHQFAQLNSYVVIPYMNYYIIAEVAAVKEKDINNTAINIVDQNYNRVIAGKSIDVLPIGTIKEGKFEFGVSVFPTLYSDVCYIKNEELDVIFNPSQNQADTKTLTIGRSVVFPDYEVKIDIDKFFGGHSAILGNTGSGKSCTIASILQTIYAKQNPSAMGSSFLIFDVNGEYSQAFNSLSNSNGLINSNCLKLNNTEKVGNAINEFNLPHWYLTVEEWALLLKASEKTQLPVLRNALGLVNLPSDNSIKHHICALAVLHIFESGLPPVTKYHKIAGIIRWANFGPSVSIAEYNPQFGNFPSAAKEEVFRNSLKAFIKVAFELVFNDNSIFFQFNDLELALELAILYEEAHGNMQIRDYCSSMLTRFKSIKSRQDYSFLRNNSTIESSIFVNSFLGIDSKSKNIQLVLVDLSDASDEVIEVVSCVLLRLIFEQLKAAKERNKYPVNIILEEAHRYIAENKNRIFGDANLIFERIAKEGRKYGMFLTVSSQRPSELSKTVLSQCSNFIVHRIQNPDDLYQLRASTPHISETVFRRLPSIPTGNALVFGQAVNLPVIVKIPLPNPTPSSDNNEVSKNWFRDLSQMELTSNFVFELKTSEPNREFDGSIPLDPISDSVI